MTLNRMMGMCNISSVGNFISISSISSMNRELGVRWYWFINSLAILNFENCALDQSCVKEMPVRYFVVA